MDAPSGPESVSPRNSLRWRLPLLMSGLVAAVLVMFLWTAYRQVETTLLRAASERAEGAATQVANLLDGERTAQVLRQLAHDPVLQRSLETRNDDTLAAAKVRLSRLTAAGSRRVELWDNAGVRLLELASTNPGATSTTAPPPGPPPTETGTGPLQAADDTVFSDAVAEILSTDADGVQPHRLGFVRIRSAFVENPPGIFGRMVGRDAVVRVGNRSGQLWTDFSHIVPALPVDLSRAGVTQYAAPGGARRLGAVSLVRESPWAAWVEFPVATTIAPASAFLGRMAAVAVAFVTVAAFVATVLATRITRPLEQFGKAAAAIAAGDYTQRVPAGRGDEIGHLGRTFNTMAADIESAADALHKSEERYRRLFASNPHPMWIYDVETLRFLDVNDAATAHYGYSRDEFLGMTIAEIRPVSDVPALLQNVAESVEGVALSGVWQHRRKDGQFRDVEISSHSLMLDGRDARAVLAHDVTDRLRAIRDLQERERLFRGMAETMPHIVWTARPDGRVDYYNRRWSEYTGLPEGDARRYGSQPIHPDDLADTVQRWTEAIQAGHVYEAEYRLRRGSDGAYRWHRGRAAPLRNDAGQILMWVGTSTDVDDARQYEQVLRSLNAELEDRVHTRTAQLEAANRELESFSYSVSHDLRAPLRHVQGYVEMVLSATEGQLSSTVQRYLKTITDATVEMGDLIDDLLAFSRIGRVQMSPGRVVLRDLVDESIRGLEMATRGRQITWQIEALPQVVGDPSMIKQVYANLLGNAVKYTRRRDVAEIRIGTDGYEDGLAVLFVRDNGAGFDMRYAHKLFGVFQRLHRSDEFEGTGIGLATVRRIVTRHGGRAWAEGQVDQGATLYFTLPGPDKVFTEPT